MNTQLEKKKVPEHTRTNTQLEGSSRRLNESLGVDTNQLKRAGWMSVVKRPQVPGKGCGV